MSYLEPVENNNFLNLEKSNVYGKQLYFSIGFILYQPIGKSQECKIAKNKIKYEL